MHPQVRDSQSRHIDFSTLDVDLPGSVNTGPAVTATPPEPGTDHSHRLSWPLSGSATARIRVAVAVVTTGMLVTSATPALSSQNGTEEPYSPDSVGAPEFPQPTPSFVTTTPPPLIQYHPPGVVTSGTATPTQQPAATLPPRGHPTPTAEPTAAPTTTAPPGPTAQQVRRAKAAAHRAAAKARRDAAARALKDAKTSFLKQDDSFVGTASLTGPQLADWFHRNYSSSGSLNVPIERIAHLYVVEGAAEGIRGDVAFAQAVLETGGFTNGDTSINNFAGIAHYDNIASGSGFASPRQGIRGQIQLLKKVAFGNGVELAHPDVSPHWGGRQAKTLGGLSHNWASDGRYGVSVFGMYRGMVQTELY